MDNYTDKLFPLRCVCLTWIITQTSCWVLTGVRVLHGQLHRQVVGFLQVCVSNMDNYTDKLLTLRCVCLTLDNYTGKMLGSYRCVCLAWTITQTSCSFTSVCVLHGQLHRQIVPFKVCVLHGQLHRQIVPFKVCVSYMDNYTDKLLGSYRCACFTWTITQTSCWVLTGVRVLHGQLHRQVVLLQVCMHHIDNYTDKLLGFYRCVCPIWTIIQTSCSL
jgi:hypothetical protein